jgi:hypothetical protein
MAHHLHKFVTLKKFFQLAVGSSQQDSSQFFEIPFVAGVDIRLRAFGESKDEKRPHAPAEQND